MSSHVPLTSTLHEHRPEDCIETVTCSWDPKSHQYSLACHILLRIQSQLWVAIHRKGSVGRELCDLNYSLESKQHTISWFFDMLSALSIVLETGIFLWAVLALEHAFPSRLLYLILTMLL